MTRARHLVWTAAITVGAFVVGTLALSSPAVPSEPAAAEFSAERAMEHVAVIAGDPHPIGSPEIRTVRAYLTGQLAALGLSPRQQTLRVPDYYEPSGGLIDVVNVMARISGTSSTGAIVLMAHYDTIPATPGANDDAAGVAVVLETARALLAAPRLGNDVILLLTDGEEPAPRYGSSAFVADHPWIEDVAFVVNIEAMGGSGPSLVVQTGEAQAWTLEQLAAAAGRPVAFSFVTATIELFGEIGTDFAPFLAVETEGIHVAYARGSSLYHTARDVPEAVAPRSVQHHGEYALGLVRKLGEVDWATEPTPGRATFFTVSPGLLLRYGDVWTLPLAVAALGVAVAALVAEARERRSGLGTTLRQAARILLGSIVMALLVAPVWMAIAAIRRQMSPGEAYLWLAALVGGGTLLRAWFRRRQASAPGGPVVLAWATLAVTSAFGLPGAAYLFTWPAIVAGAALVLWRPAGAASQRLRLSIVTAVTSVVLVPAVEIFFAFAQPRPGNLDSEMTEMFVVVVFLVALAVELLTPFVGPASRRPDAEPVSAAVGKPETVPLAS